MKYYDNSDLFGMADQLFIHRFITKKYDVVYSPNLRKVGIMHKHWLWSNSILRYYKDRSLLMKLDSTLFFNVLPDIEEIMSCNKWMSDKILDAKIDRFLKLKAFL